jgi:hypothetical protein
MSDSKEVEEAKRVLRAAYYQSASREVADLVRAYFDGEYDDEDGQLERLHEACESHVTYTADNYLTVFASEESDDGFDQMAELGGLDQQAHGGAGVSGTEVMQRWAYSTFEFDVLRLLQNEYGAAVKLLSEPMADGLDSDQRLEWLAENHGTLLFEDGDDKHYYVGVVDAGTATEVDLGLVTLGRRTSERRTVPEKFDIITGPERSARDSGTMTALRDALIDAGFFAERSSAAAPKKAQPEHVSLAQRDLANRGYHVLRGSSGSRARVFAATDYESPDHPLRPIHFIVDLDNTLDREGDRLTTWTEVASDQWEPVDGFDETLVGERVGLVRIDSNDGAGTMFDLPVYEYHL